jgi:hypothetical protein
MCIATVRIPPMAPPDRYLRQHKHRSSDGTPKTRLSIQSNPDRSSNILIIDIDFFSYDMKSVETIYFILLLIPLSLRDKPVLGFVSTARGRLIIYFLRKINCYEPFNDRASGSKKSTTRTQQQ